MTYPFNITQLIVTLYIYSVYPLYIVPLFVLIRVSRYIRLLYLDSYLLSNIGLLNIIDTASILIIISQITRKEVNNL